MAYHLQAQSDIPVDSYLVFLFNRSRCLQKMTNWIAILVAVIINSSLLSIMIHSIYINDSSLGSALLITGISFDLLSVMFLIVGCSI